MQTKVPLPFFNDEPFVDTDCLGNVFGELSIEKGKEKGSKKCGNHANNFNEGCNH